MAEPAPRPLHLFLGGLLGGLLGVAAFIVVPNLLGEPTDSAGLQRFSATDAVTASAAVSPPRTPKVWEGRLAEPDWDTAWSAKPTFTFDVSTTNASGDGRVQVEVVLRVQEREAVKWVEDIDTRTGAGTYRVEGRAIEVDPDRPLLATASLRVQRFPNGGADWSITVSPLTFTQETRALDTDHDGVPQPSQPIEGMPSYFLSALLALIGVNAAYLLSRNPAWSQRARKETDGPSPPPPAEGPEKTRR